MSGWNQSSCVDNSWKGEPNASKKDSGWFDNSWSGDLNAPNNESGVDQSWRSNAPKKKASTRTNQSTSYFEEEDDDDALKDGGHGGGTYNDRIEDVLVELVEPTAQVRFCLSTRTAVAAILYGATQT